MSSTFVRVTFIGLLVGFGSPVLAQVPHRAQILEKLQLNLAQVRALPKGERPAPPDEDLKALVGASRIEIRKALALPSYCEPEGLTNCEKSSSWKYEWGPPNPESQFGDGYVTVTTGGPWLLVIEFSRDSVVAASWLGQR